MLTSNNDQLMPRYYPGVNGWFQRSLFKRLNCLQHGRLVIRDGAREMVFGSRDDVGELTVTATIVDPRFYAYAALNGPLGIGEAFVERFWHCDDLVKLVRLFVRNRQVLDQLNGGLARLLQPALRWLHYKNRNTVQGSRRNIAAHYDLGNELFELFLDRNLMYSSAIFEHADDHLDVAAEKKLQRICEKLELGPSDHVLEIGTGWGGFAIHAATHYGCRVTTTTISEQQFNKASERIAKAGLNDNVTVLLRDYRELSGEFDKLVSIEMVEAVGHQFLDTYFAQCGKLLKPHGMMLIQAITIEDQRYQRALKTTDFIKRYIFPGSFIPSVSRLIASVSDATNMKLYQMEDIGQSYALTLRAWRQRFLANLSSIKALGYSDEFVRMWEYYFCYCEGGFTERQISNVQLLLTKPEATPDLYLLNQASAMESSCDQI